MLKQIMELIKQGYTVGQIATRTSLNPQNVTNLIVSDPLFKENIHNTNLFNTLLEIHLFKTLREKLFYAKSRQIA